MKVTGFLRNDADAANIADKNHAAYYSLKAEITQNTDEILENLRRIESLIEYGSMILRISQPPIEGKYDVRWWKDQYKDISQPTIVRWYKAKNGVAAGKLTVPRPVKRINESDFKMKHGNYAYAITLEIKSLIESWDKTLIQLKTVNKNLKLNRAIRVYSPIHLGSYASRLHQMHLDMWKRLRNEGRAVPDEYNPDRIQFED